MTRNPDVVRKAQDEIDRIVGNERLPHFTDRPSLPYVDALVEELFRYGHCYMESRLRLVILVLSRWNPPIPLG